MLERQRGWAAGLGVGSDLSDDLVLFTLSGSRRPVGVVDLRTLTTRRLSGLGRAWARTDYVSANLR